MIFKLKGHQKEHRSRVKEEVTKEIIKELDELVTKELLEIDKDTDLEYVKDKLMYDFLKYRVQLNKGNDIVINDVCREYYLNIRNNPNYEFKIP